MFGRTHTPETRAKMSERKAQAITEGRFKPYGTHNKKGTYTSTKTGRSHYFKSSWEEAVMKYLDASDSVVTWDYEHVRIPYYHDDAKFWYVPDFVVVFENDEVEMWEVKPKEFLGAERVVRTTEAGRKYCDENGMLYVIIDKNALVQRGIYALCTSIS